MQKERVSVVRVIKKSKHAILIQRAAAIVAQLKHEYPNSKCSLYYESLFQLLVATMLSAQCTDARVNQVTPKLFKKYPTPETMMKAKVEEIEDLVRTTGFFRSKARAISETSRDLVEKWGGTVPETLEELTQLRGVGRKTANVVLGTGRGVPGMVVDTHVKRLTFRMGLTKQSDPEKVEQDLMKVIAQEDWVSFSHLMIDHGRKVCTARRAKCHECVISQHCPKLEIS